MSVEEIYETLKRRPDVVEIIEKVRSLPESKQDEAIAFIVEFCNERAAG